MSFKDKVVDKMAEEVGKKAAEVVVKATAVGVAGAATVVVGVAGVVAGTTAAVAGGVVKGTQALIGDKETRHFKKEQKYLNQKAKEEQTCLIIQHINNPTGQLCVCDVDGNILFQSNGILSTDDTNGSIGIFRPDGYCIAQIIKIVSGRNTLFQKKNPDDYSFMVNGNSIGIMKNRVSSADERYVIEPHGWCVKNGKEKGDYSVCDGDKEIIYLSKRKGYDWPTYIVNFPKDKYNLIATMIMMVAISRDIKNK